jgi:hypothetical protein
MRAREFIYEVEYQQVIPDTDDQPVAPVEPAAPDAPTTTPLGSSVTPTAPVAPTAPTAPVSPTTAKVLHKGMTVVIGNQARKKGDANWRNNNPGNIGAGSTAKELGSIGANGRWAIFPDTATGFKAMHDLLMSPAYSTLTAKQAVDKWAPPNENNTAGYIAQLAKAGLDMNKKYSQFTPAQQQLYQQTVNRIEGGHAGEILAVNNTTATPTA